MIQLRGLAPAWSALAHALWLSLLLFVQHLAPALAAGTAPEEAVAERRVKAAYLYRFAGYTEWPEGAFARPDSPLVIGVWGNDELADDLTRLVAARTIEGRAFEVRRLKDADAIAGLHIVFVAGDRVARLPDTLANVPLRGTLVVTEASGALRHGSAINFVTVEGQIRFELSPEAAEKRGLKLSSRLVAVSTNLQARGR